MSIKKLNSLKEDIINNHKEYSDIEMYQKLNVLEQICHVKNCNNKSFTQIAHEKGYILGKYEASDLEDAANDYADEKVNLYFEDYNNSRKILNFLEDLWRLENTSDDFIIPDSNTIYNWIKTKIK
jgi:hypothetical protein